MKLLPPIICLALLTAVTGTTNAALVTLTASDSAGTSSFNTAGQWSNAAAPSSGNSYTDATFTLRTPQDTGNYSFAGGTLNIGDGTNITGLLAYKGTGGSTITVAALTLNKGNVSNATSTATFTLAGNIQLLSGGGIFDSGDHTRTMLITANISGAGSLLAQNSGDTSGTLRGTVSLLGSNSYSGGTTIAHNTALDVRVDGGLGTGNVVVGSVGSLILEMGTTNNYIADTASLILNSTSSGVFLNFSGTDTIGGLSFNGGSTFAAVGTYGAVGSGAEFTNSMFTGSGLLLVAVPEPASWKTFAIGGGALFCLINKRNRRRKVL